MCSANAALKRRSSTTPNPRLKPDVLSLTLR
jgi:hypothetical protein